MLTRLTLGTLVTIAASATCGPRPATMPWEVQHFDAGTADGGAPVSLVADCTPCETWGAVEIRGPLPSQLDELSGLAASAAHPGVIYAHNDSGDSPRLFALDTFGRLLAELKLSGAQAIDWEDMALGPCDSDARAPCLFLADIGDNLRRRGTYTVYRAREPALPIGADQTPELNLPFDRLPFIYPNGERNNAETLLSHPATGALYVVSKGIAGQPSRVFRFPTPLTPDVTVTLVEVGPLSVPEPTDILVTGGDIHPCGTSLLVRMYNRAVELREVPDAGFETTFTTRARDVPTAIDEPQGEAITWGPDGQSYFTASEHTGQSLHRVQCVRAP
ncbi:MAG: hypothetical protein JNK82_41025 [Myxococcaceae bacterium]|nr:hypothetical protein [Myxococcaceae bacterium]